MRTFMLIAAAAIPAVAVADPAGPLSTISKFEEAAPTSDCRPASFEGKEWCWIKVRLPDGSLVGFVVRFDEHGELDTASRLIRRGPEKAAAATQSQ